MKNRTFLVAFAAIPGLVACSDKAPQADREQELEIEAAGSATQQVYETSGEVTALSSDGVTVEHDPVEEIDWPSMTMRFEVTDPVMTDALAVGDQVDFGFRESETGYEVISITPAAR
ncbi:MAG: copper-binding protein [Parasphingopyxis sp.]|uniref:copper-binding protein n=1 Tax=Parasphingopyxis sp. TaxID=1920299 RepID=UPI0032EB9A04